MNAASDALQCLTIETRGSLAEALAEVLPGLDLPMASWTDEDTGRARVEIYLDSPAAVEAARARVEALLAAWPEPDPWVLSAHPLLREDWATAWKRFFHAERVSERIVVRPSWEPFEPRPEDRVIVLDPGLSFGTGQHGTTRACLQFLDDLAARRGGSLLDIGCGSGILAIAGAKLGFAPVCAIDHDPQAVQCAKENVQANGETARIQFLEADIRTFRGHGAYDVVVANLMAGLLLEAAPAVAACCARGAEAALIVSGILTTQAAEVGAAFARLGFHETRRITLQEWTSLLLQAA